jgi:hypothetical protein
MSFAKDMLRASKEVWGGYVDWCKGNYMYQPRSHILTIWLVQVRMPHSGEVVSVRQVARERESLL